MWRCLRDPIRLAVSVEHRLVTYRQTDGRTDSRRQLIPALASVARVKIGHTTLTTPSFVGMSVIRLIVPAMHNLYAYTKFVGKVNA